ncbi:MAG: hypothetical protein ACREIC_06790, partial [Limisphaerales bacterium]
MKRNTTMNRIAKLTLALLALTTLGKFNTWAGAPVQGMLIKPFLPNVDRNGKPATSPNTPMGSFFCIGLNEPILPILTPSGQPVTLAEYMQATGTASAKCDNKGAHVVMHLAGLIPHGLYTAWFLRFDSNGGLIAEGSLGAPDGSQNLFSVSSDGTAELSVFQPTGPLSMFGSVNGCALDG